MVPTRVSGPRRRREGTGSVFRRRRAVDSDEAYDDLTGDEVADGDPDDAGTAGTAEAAAAPAPVRRPEGPWDADDAPEDELLDLGGLRVPLIDGFDISLTAEQDVPVLVTYGGPDGLMQLHAFAAPRSAGIWDEVRQEIAESLAHGGGSSQEAAGPFGTELAAQIPVQTPEGQTVLQPARFIGVDGPRWFLRALITGPIVQDVARVGELEGVLRRVVVVRGGDAMAPRDVIPLRIPREVLQAAEAAAEQGELGDAEAGMDDGAGAAGAPDGGERPQLQLPERGPEITEVR